MSDHFTISLDLEQTRRLYLAAAEDLHPAMRLSGLSEEQHVWSFAPDKLRVLFLCTENSARSQIAEGLLRHLSQGNVEAYSAGSAPGPCIHPLAVRVLKEAGIECISQYPKHLDVFKGQHFDAVITVCDKVVEACPTFPGDTERIHWSFADPVLAQGSEDDHYRTFRQVSLQLATRIRFFLTVLERRQQRQNEHDEQKHE